MRTVIPDLEQFFTSPPFNYNWIGTGKVMARRNYNENIEALLSMEYYSEYRKYNWNSTGFILRRAKETDGDDCFLMYLYYPKLKHEIMDNIDDYVGGAPVFETYYAPIVCKLVDRHLEGILDTTYSFNIINEFSHIIKNARLLDFYSKTTGGNAERVIKMLDFYVANVEKLPPEPKYPPSLESSDAIIRDALSGKYRFYSSMITCDIDKLKGIITQLKFKYQKDFKPSFKDYAHII